MGQITCAFCKGEGKDPFDLLSALAICQVCHGIGRVEVKDPLIKCPYCGGTGVYPRNGRVTCTVCYGKGSITIKGLTELCPDCRGTARVKDSDLSCVRCRGKGLIKKR